MIQRPDRKTKRNRKRGGAVIMELGLMLLPTFALLFGFIDVGFLIFTWNTLQNAVREGTRYAITQQTMGTGVGQGQIPSIKAEVSRWAMGFVNVSSTATTGPQIPWIEVQFFDPASPSTAVTGNGSNSPGNIVEVSIRNYPYKWMAPISGSMIPGQGVYASPGSQLAVAVYSADVLGGTGLAGGNPPLN